MRGSWASVFRKWEPHVCIWNRMWGNTGESETVVFTDLQIQMESLAHQGAAAVVLKVEKASNFRFCWIVGYSLGNFTFFSGYKSGQDLQALLPPCHILFSIFFLHYWQLSLFYWLETFDLLLSCKTMQLLKCSYFLDIYFTQIFSLSSLYLPLASYLSQIYL